MRARASVRAVRRRKASAAISHKTPRLAIPNSSMRPLSGGVIRPHTFSERWETGRAKVPMLEKCPVSRWQRTRCESARRTWRGKHAQGATAACLRDRSWSNRIVAGLDEGDLTKQGRRSKARRSSAAGHSRGCLGPATSTPQPRPLQDGRRITRSRTGAPERPKEGVG